MAAIDGISSISNAATYQTKAVPQVNAVEAVDESNAGAEMASQVVTVQNKDKSDNGEQGSNKENEKKNGSDFTNDQIKKAVDELNKKMRNNSALEYGIHDKTNRVTIKVVDKDSKDVIKEYPAEETLDMLAKVWELAGILVDEKL